DFDGDGFGDIALAGGPGWTTVPIALSNGVFADGRRTFGHVNLPVPNFPEWAQAPGARLLAADFNLDGFTDLALTGPSTWATIPVALFDGNIFDPNAFSVINNPAATFAAWAGVPGAQPVVGDFSGDGFPDIALTG